MNVLALITCKPTGKGYVCVTQNGDRDPGEAFDPKRYGHGTKFKLALKRYGRKNFSIQVLGSGYRTRESLHRAERRAVDKHQTLWPFGYNLRPGGNGPGWGGSEHSRLIRIAQARPEVKRKMTEANRDIANRPSVKRKHSARMKARWADPEFKKTVVAKIKTRWTVSARRLQSKRISAAITAWWARPEVRRRQVVALRKFRKRPEYLKRMSEATTNFHKRKRGEI